MELVNCSKGEFYRFLLLKKWLSSKKNSNLSENTEKCVYIEIDTIDRSKFWELIIRCSHRQTEMSEYIDQTASHCTQERERERKKADK